ncbi:FHA domain-containing protein [Thauera sp. WH-1]|uniref:FHA domain-containing protein n=1 Tax=Thauera sp. WH-1 TaxID=3398230 RepID=UPI0039FC39AE
MPKLVLSMDGLVLKELALTKERTTIGRKPDNDIQIDNLAISGHHAVITCITNDAFLEDQNSTNGTYLNGQPVKKNVLRNNDVIELGKYKIKFLTDGVKTGLSPSEMIDTAALKPFEMPGVSTDVTASAAGPAPTETQVVAAAARHQLEQAGGPAAAAERLGVIQVLSGANAGRELQLTKSMTTLGKPGRQVAVITRRPHGYFITHVEGASFPLVNGKAIDAQARHLNDHDIVELAGVKMEFFLRG